MSTPAIPMDGHSPRALSRALLTVEAIFGIDLRTLALFRGMLAVMVIADLVMRARDLTAHYSDRGILPRDVLIGELNRWFPSFHLMSGSTSIQSILFILSGLIAFCLLVGYRTRLATFASWIFLISLQTRNPLISQGADLLLRLLLFWSMFLPLGARFSVDAALDRSEQREPNAYFSMATVALLVQVMSVYLFTALLKTGNVWFPDGTAVYYTLHIDYLATPFAVWLRQFPRVLQALTYFVWSLELAAPFLVFVPFFNLPIRLVTMALLIGMHIGFALCLEIGIFPYVSITSLLVLTPGWVWDRLGAWVRSPERRGITIYYDEPCEFCRKVCLLLRTFLLPHETPILPAQGNPEIHREMQAHNSWVVVDRTGRRHVRWDAVAFVFRRSFLFQPLGMLFSARFMQRLGDGIYEMVARNRGRLAEWSEVVLPYHQSSIRPTAVGNLVVGGLMLLVLWTNVRSLPYLPFKLPNIAGDIKSTLRLSQKWEMFAPAPSRIDGWFVIRGETPKGPVDVLHERDGEPDWTRPESLAREYPTYRWRKYLIAIKNENDAKYRPYYAQYLCRTWNDRHGYDERIDLLEIYFNREIVPRDYLTRQTERMLIYKYRCSAPKEAEPEPPSLTGTDSF